MLAYPKAQVFKTIVLELREIFQLRHAVKAGQASLPLWNAWQAPEQRLRLVCCIAKSVANATGIDHTPEHGIFLGLATKELARMATVRLLHVRQLCGRYFRFDHIPDPPLHRPLGEIPCVHRSGMLSLESLKNFF